MTVQLNDINSPLLRKAVAPASLRILPAFVRNRMEKTAFQEVGKIEPLYTGGKLVVSSTGEFFVCACTDELYVVEFSTGKVVKRFEGVSQPSKA
jgi:hypothetical protein